MTRAQQLMYRPRLPLVGSATVAATPAPVRVCPACGGQRVLSVGIYSYRCGACNPSPKEA